jgi:hypothetical protein
MLGTCSLHLSYNHWFTHNLPYLLHNPIQMLVPIQMRRPLTTPTRSIRTLRIFPDMLTLGTPSPGRESISPVPTTTPPMGLAVGLPRTLRTSDADRIHLIGLAAKIRDRIDLDKDRTKPSSRTQRSSGIPIPLSKKIFCPPG